MQVCEAILIEEDPCKSILLGKYKSVIPAIQDIVKNKEKVLWCSKLLRANPLLSAHTDTFNAFSAGFGLSALLPYALLEFNDDTTRNRDDVIQAAHRGLLMWPQLLTRMFEDCINRDAHKTLTRGASVACMLYSRGIGVVQTPKYVGTEGVVWKLLALGSLAQMYSTDDADSLELSGGGAGYECQFCGRDIRHDNMYVHEYLCRFRHLSADVVDGTYTMRDNPTKEKGEKCDICAGLVNDKEAHEPKCASVWLYPGRRNITLLTWRTPCEHCPGNHCHLPIPACAPITIVSEAEGSLYGRAEKAPPLKSELGTTHLDVHLFMNYANSPGDMKKASKLPGISTTLKDRLEQSLNMYETYKAIHANAHAYGSPAKLDPTVLRDNKHEGKLVFYGEELLAQCMPAAMFGATPPLHTCVLDDDKTYGSKDGGSLNVDRFALKYATNIASVAFGHGETSFPIPGHIPVVVEPPFSVAGGEASWPGAAKALNYLRPDEHNSHMRADWGSTSTVDASKPKISGPLSPRLFYPGSFTAEDKKAATGKPPKTSDAVAETARWFAARKPAAVGKLYEPDDSESASSDTDDEFEVEKEAKKLGITISAEEKEAAKTATRKLDKKKKSGKRKRSRSRSRSKSRERSRSRSKSPAGGEPSSSAPRPKKGKKKATGEKGENPRERSVLNLKELFKDEGLSERDIKNLEKKLETNSRYHLPVTDMDTNFVGDPGSLSATQWAQLLKEPGNPAITRLNMLAGGGQMDKYARERVREMTNTLGLATCTYMGALDLADLAGRQTVREEDIVRSFNAVAERFAGPGIRKIYWGTEVPGVVPKYVMPDAGLPGDAAYKKAHQKKKDKKKKDTTAK